MYLGPNLKTALDPSSIINYDILRSLSGNLDGCGGLRQDEVLSISDTRSG